MSPASGKAFDADTEVLVRPLWKHTAHLEWRSSKVVVHFSYQNMAKNIPQLFHSDCHLNLSFVGTCQLPWWFLNVENSFWWVWEKSFFSKWANMSWIHWMNETRSRFCSFHFVQIKHWHKKGLDQFCLKLGISLVGLKQFAWRGATMCGCFPSLLLRV